MSREIQIPLSRPDITEKEIQAVINVLSTPHLSLGPKVVEFEEKFAEYVGTKFAVAVNSGTSGLHLAIKSLGIGVSDAVITTPFSFIASANCILYENAIPIFVDIEPRTFNIDPIKIRDYLTMNCRRCQKTGRPIDVKTERMVKAILPVHVFGHPCQMDELIQIAKEYNLFLIEDACEAIGAEYYGKKVGRFGKAGVFAFYPNKQITTGEGGMIVTDDEGISNLCKSLRNQGRDIDGKWLSHVRLGYNYRISDISCALGVEQLQRIEQILERREMVARQYNELLGSHVNIPQTLDGVKRSWFVYIITLPTHFSRQDRNEILAFLGQNGIQCSNYFPPIHLQPFYRESYGYKEGCFPICESVAKRTVALPFYNHMGEDQVLYVVEILKKIEGDVAVRLPQLCESFAKDYTAFRPRPKHT